MDAEIVATITTIASAAREAAAAIRAALARGKKPDSTETLSHVDELETRVLELKEIAFRLDRELGQAHEENAKLRKDIREKEERATDREQYKRKKVGQAMVLEREGEPGTYYCPICMAKKGIAIPIQPHAVLGGALSRLIGSHFCSTCETSFPLQG